MHANHDVEILDRICDKLDGEWTIKRRRRGTYVLAVEITTNDDNSPRQKTVTFQSERNPMSEAVNDVMVSMASAHLFIGLDDEALKMDLGFRLLQAVGLDRDQANRLVAQRSLLTPFDTSIIGDHLEGRNVAGN